MFLVHTTTPTVRLIRGSELKHRKLYRIMNPDLVHHGFQWQLGDNVDTVPFKPERLCEAGGLHFTTLEQLSNFFIVPANVVTLMDHWLAEVTVDADEPVWEEQSTAATGWKAHRVTVKSLTRMRDVPQHERLTIALGCPVERQYNPEIMAQMWAAAVAHNNMSLALLPAERQTDELVEVAVTHYPSSFRHVANQTFDVCCRAVSINPTCQKRIRDDAMRLRVVLWLRTNKQS